MLLRRAVWAVTVIACLIVPVAVQAQGDYLDVYTVKVKPEKVADFEALAKKIAQAERQHNGDTWLAVETAYGEGETYGFVSSRQNYADLDKASESFMSALNQAFGKEGAQKILNDWENCIASSRTELRKRRPDLSRKMPDAASYAKFIGDSRLVRTTVVHIKPGRSDDFESLLKEIKAAGEKNENTAPVLVSQAYEGTRGGTYYVTSLRASMGGFDNNPSLREILGEEGFKKFLQISADTIDNTQSVLFRFSPEMSNPPQDVIAAAPDFWQPKPVIATHKTKAKAAAVEPAAEKTKQ